MTNRVRSELFRALNELSESCPEYRFGQLIANLAFLARGASGDAVWNVEDEELPAAARQHIEDWKQCHVSIA